MRRIIVLATVLLAAAPVFAHSKHNSMFWFWRLSAHFGHASMATWYGNEFCGRRTASGERMNCSALTAAHRSLPFGTYVKVTNLMNHRSCVVRINDRGPYRAGAVIDLSPASRNCLGAKSSIPVSMGY